MVERLIIGIIFVALAAAAYQALRRWQMRRAAHAAPHDMLLAEMRPGIPAVVYFTTPTCAPCRAQQRPALQRLQAELREKVQVIEVNAHEQPEVASRWGVFSVPTTFILDGAGLPRAVNHGVAGSDKLRMQLEGL